MQSALFSNSSPLFHYACPHFSPHASNETSRQFALSLSRFFHGSVWSLQQARVARKTHSLRCLRKSRGKKGWKGGGEVLCFVLLRGGMRGIKENECQPRAPLLPSSIDSIHLFSIPSLHSFYRALPCYACPFEWKLVSNHRGIPVDWDRVPDSR